MPWKPVTPLWSHREKKTCYVYIYSGRIRFALQSTLCTGVTWRETKNNIDTRTYTLTGTSTHPRLAGSLHSCTFTQHSFTVFVFLWSSLFPALRSRFFLSRLLPLTEHTLEVFLQHPPAQRRFVNIQNSKYWHQILPGSLCQHLCMTQSRYNEFII